jgi:hypothetical protein
MADGVDEGVVELGVVSGVDSCALIVMGRVSVSAIADKGKSARHNVANATPATRLSQVSRPGFTHGSTAQINSFVPQTASHAIPPYIVSLTTGLLGPFSVKFRIVPQPANESKRAEEIDISSRI